MRALLFLLCAFLSAPTPAEEPDRPLGGAAEAPSLTPEGAWPAEPPVPELALLVQSDLDGRFAEADCRGVRFSLPDLADAAGAARAVADERAARGLPPPLALNAGDLVGPSAFGRFVLSRPGGPQAVARMLRRAGFQAFVLGNQEISAERPRVLEFLVEARRLGLRALAANLSCDEARRALCDAVEPWALLRVGGLRVAVLGVVLEDMAAVVDPARFEGLSVQDPAEVAVALARKIREEARPDLVVVLAHVERETTAPARSLALARALGSAADVVVTNRLGGAGPAAVATTGGPVVLASDMSGAALAVARVTLGGVQLRPTGAAVARAPPAEADAKLEEELEAWGKAYCEELARPLAARVPAGFDATAFLDAALRAARPVAGADVGLANLHVVDMRAFPLGGALSRADLFAALPYENQLMALDVPGRRLRELWAEEERRKARGAPELLFVGLASTPSGLRVNGRPLDDAQTYRLVVPDFVARGGGNYLDPRAVSPWPVVPEGFDAPPTFAQFLEKVFSGDDPALAQGRLADAFPDPAKRFRWTVGGNVDGSAADSRFANTARYGEGRLARPGNFRTLRLDAAARVEADSLDHSFRLAARGRYVTQTLAGAAGSAEIEDLDTLEALYRLRSLPHALENSWWAPVPYLGLAALTEVTPLESRGWRRLEATPSLGVRFQILPRLEAKAGFVARRELLQPDATTRLGLELGYELGRTPLVALGATGLDVESRLDYLRTDFAGLDQQEATFRVKLAAPLVKPLLLTLGYDLFAFRQGGNAWGYTSDVTVGLGVRFENAWQAY